MFLTSIDGCYVTTSQSKAMYSAAETSVESSLTKTFYVYALWRTITVQTSMRDLKKCTLYGVSALERFCYKGFLRNSFGTKFFVRLREVSALKDLRFREVPLQLKTKTTSLFVVIICIL